MGFLSHSAPSFDLWVGGKGGPLGLWLYDGPTDTHVTPLWEGAEQLQGGDHCGTGPSLKLGRIFLHATLRGCSSLKVPPPEPFSPWVPPSWAQITSTGKTTLWGLGFPVLAPPSLSVKL